jgi:hypothetical protein
MRLARRAADGPQTANVVKTEEKGSDVNLATYLLMDAFDGDCELAVVISNDSDLATPIQSVRQRFGINVGILNPHQNRSWTLFNCVDFYRPIRKGPLSASQFADKLQDSDGAFMKPAGW